MEKVDTYAYVLARDEAPLLGMHAVLLSYFCQNENG